MVDRAVIIKEAQKYLAKGQIDKAIAEWERVAKESPDANTYNTIGDLCLKKGDTQKAIENFHGAARVFREDGFSLKALAIYKKILNIKPSDADSLYALGELNEEKDISTDAIRYYLAAADMLAKENKKDRIPKVYARIINLAPSNLPLRNKIADFFSKEGFVSEAVTEYIEISTLYGELGDDPKAKEYLEKALEIQPGRKEALIRLSLLYEKKGDLDRAIQYLEIAREKAGEDMEILTRCARLLCEINSFEDAAAKASKAIELDPSSMDAKKLLGDIYHMSGDMQRAWDVYKTVLDEMIFKEKFDEAIDILNTFKETDPIEARKKLISLYNQTGDTEASFNELLSLAETYFEKGILQDALGCFKEASNSHPENEPVKERIKEIEKTLGVETEEVKEKSLDEVFTEADIFLRYGLYAEAGNLLEGVKLKAPENIDVHVKLKTLYTDTNETEQAVTECIILAELYGRAGDEEKRQAVIKEAYAINPEDPRLHAKFGAAEEAPKEEKGPAIEDYTEEIAEADFYIREGLYNEAAEIYRRLLQTFPGDPEIKSKLEAIEANIEAAPGIKEEKPQEIFEKPETKEEEETISVEDFSSMGPETVEAQEISEPALESDVLEIFEEFKKGLEKELEAEDSETHYNLGIAYKEMGLIDDAIKEFQGTKHDPKFFVQSVSMLGICYMQKGLYPLAIDAFQSALMKLDVKDEAHWGHKFDLAEAYEKNDNIEEAFKLYTAIYGWNSSFRSVGEKINSLKGMLPKAEPSAGAVKEKRSRVSYI